MSRGPDIVEIFEDCLAEHGVTDVDVLHTKDEFSDTLTIRKKVGEQILGYRVSFNETTPTTDSRKNIALKAKEAANGIKEKLIDSYEWDGRYSQVSVYEGGWAECRVCGEQVEVPPQRVAPAFTTDAEFSTPHPLPKEPDNYVTDMSGHQEVLLRLYLLGRLRDHCPPECRNSKHHRKF